MVATDETPTQNSPENTGTFGKLKQTLSSSLLTAQDKVTNKMSPRPSLIPDVSDSATDSTTATLQSVQNKLLQAQQQQQLQQQQQQQQNQNNANKGEPGKPPIRTGACRVCLKSFKPDDYSKTCFECQQRVCEDCASYSKLDENEDANTWRCSVCRRKMASRVCIPQDSTDSLLDVPVLEALQRRHSDVKIGSTNNLGPSSNGCGLAPPRSPELRRHSDVSPASLKELEKLKGSKTPGGDLDWRRGNRSMAPSRSNSPPRKSDFDQPNRISSRRQSIRVTRQHSYDEDIKSGGSGGGPQADTGLGIPAPMPRRASAYDVFAPGVLAAAQAQATPNKSEQESTTIRPGSRRPSFRVPAAEESPQKDSSPSPDKINSPVLQVEDDRRMRRRGSQLPDIAALRDRGAIPNQLGAPVPYVQPALEDLEAPRRQTSMDGEAIKIVIHDVDSGPICASKKRIILRKDPSDKAHRTRGFGMRVVGGKTGADGRLFAYIVWTVPGGPAEKGGLQQGDKILEWNGVSLIDRSFEEVCSIMDRTGDVVELLVEHATDFRMCDLLDEQIPPGSQGGPRKSGDGVGLGLTPDTETSTDKSPSSPTRRKLPKTPEQIAREKQVSGRVQIQVWYHGERNELVVSLMAGDDLAPRDDSSGHGNLPEAYAKVKVSPKTGDGHVAQTEVSAPTQSPIWNATLSFSGISPENLMDRYLEIELWDLVPQTESIFLGECNVDLQKAFLDDRAVWYRLEDPRSLRLSTSISSKTPSASPRGSIGGDVGRLLRRIDYSSHRSMSDDMDSIGDGASLLHPDHAWIAGSRRGSSQSETLEVEVYQLGKDFSRSLPGSRRSSFQDREENKEIETTPPPASYSRDRRRSSCIRKDPDEILRSLKAVKGELGRTMSLSGPAEKISSRPSSRRSSRTRKESVMEIPQYFLSSSTKPPSPPSDDDDHIKWKGSSNFCNIIIPKDQSPILGPGQIQPKGYRLTSGRYGELKLDFFLTKGMLEVEVISARNIVPVDCETPPDTYVKCYLKDGDRLKYKKKTRVIRHSAEPIYRQTLKYAGSDISGRSIVIMVWQKCVGFEHNQGLGGAEIHFDKLALTQHVGGWYPLFPMHSFGSDSNDSP